jgi:putative aminopeptidase FrvX
MIEAIFEIQQALQNMIDTLVSICQENNIPIVKGMLNIASHATMLHHQQKSENFMKTVVLSMACSSKKTA